MSSVVQDPGCVEGREVRIPQREQIDVRAHAPPWPGWEDIDCTTTLICADYQPSSREADLVDNAFRGTAIEVDPLSDTRKIR